MVNDQTEHLGLPLPSPDNMLSDDVLRLRGSLVKLDQEAASNQQKFTDANTAIEDGARTTRKLHLRRLLQLDF